jgi:hypothetical protein
MTMPRALGWAAVVAIAIVASPRAARAESPRVLFVASAPTAFSERVRAEIEAMGFVIELASGIAERGTTTAVAAARVIEGSTRRVELWIADPATGRLTLRAVVMPSPDDDEATETVRASEQLRAFFQPLREPSRVPPPPAPPRALPEPPPAEPPSPAPLREPPKTAPVAAPRFVLGAHVEVPFQPGGAAASLGLRARWMALPVLGVGAFASVPLAGTTVKASEGSASIAAPLFGADLAAVTDLTRWLRLGATAGIALAWVRTSGFASEPYHGTTSNVVSALPLLGVEIAPRLTERVRLVLGGRLGFSLPRVDIAFAGRPVAVWGRPLGLLSLGVSVDG